MGDSGLQQHLSRCYLGGTYSGLNLEGSRMLKAVNDFIARSSALQILEIDGIHYSPQLLASLGSAIINHHTGLRHLSLRGLSIGDDGLRVLTPHLAKSRIQCLTISNCGLTESSVPFLTSILKSHEAMLDKHFWNSTLRVYPTEDGIPSRNPVMVCDADATDCNHGLVTLDVSRNKLGNKGALQICEVMRQNQWILGLNLSDNQIEERGVYHILRHLVSPSDKECALISLHLDGNPGCDANVEEVLHSMNDMTAESPLFASLRPDVAAVLRKWLVVKKVTSRHKLRSHESSEQVLYDSREGDDPDIRHEYMMLGNAHERRNDRRGEGRGWENPRMTVGGDTGAVYAQRIDHDEEDDDFKATAPRSALDTDYLREFPFEEMSPNHPGDSLLDGRPPSRAGLRPRVSHESSPDEKRPDSRLGVRKQHSQRDHSDDVAAAARVGKGLFSNSAVRYTNPYEQELRNSTVSQRRDHQSTRRSRSSERERRLPRDETRPYTQRSRSADAHRTGRAPTSDQYIPGDYMHTTASFDSYRKKALKVFEDTRRSLSAAPATPFVPASAHVNRSTNARKIRPASPSRFLDSYDMARMRMEQGRGGDFDITDPQRYRRLSRNELLKDDRNEMYVTKSREALPARRRKLASGDSRTTSTRMSGHRSGSRISAFSNGSAICTAPARRCSQGRSRSAATTTTDCGSYGTRKKANRKKSNGEQILEEMGHSMMQELSKVVDIVSSDLRVVSQQLKILSTSMSESMIAANVSRDVSRSYGDARVSLQGTTDESDVVGRYDDLSPSRDSVEWGQRLHEGPPENGGQAIAPAEVLARRSPQDSDKRAGASHRYITDSSSPSGKHSAESGGSASQGTGSRGGSIVKNGQSSGSARIERSSPVSKQLQLSADNDHILTKMIQDGMRNKLLQLMRDSAD